MDKVELRGQREKGALDRLRLSDSTKHLQGRFLAMAHPELDQLLNAVLPFAQQMLADQGDVRPFGAALSPQGEIAFIEAHDAEERTRFCGHFVA